MVNCYPKDFTTSRNALFKTGVKYLLRLAQLLVKYERAP